ncbi:hypothetical protein AB0E88_24110 [Streptomyces sp. NPDC028635]|uniref:hypothetical protein n=1 Tax=Streptomyces sp. NPDC028635 TaxID=3154800 RepID=UPI0033E96B66
MTAAAALTAALTLAACSGGGGDSGSGGSGSGDGKTTAPATTQSPSTGATTPQPAAGALQGNWLTTTNGKAVVLVLTGTQAALFTTGGSVCSGPIKDRTIQLKCKGTAAGHTNGHIDSVDKTTLKVTWVGDVGTETYTRSENGGMPSRFPTAGLGS